MRVRISVAGRVQGVWFRQSCQDRALAEGVRGWVRNCEDGTVEAVFEGEPGAVERMVGWARVGPPDAQVTRFEAHPEDPAGETAFAVR